MLQGAKDKEEGGCCRVLKTRRREDAAGYSLQQ